MDADHVSFGKATKLGVAAASVLLLATGCRFGDVLMTSATFTGPATNTVVNAWEQVYTPMRFRTFRESGITALVVGSCSVIDRAVGGGPGGNGGQASTAFVKRPVDVRLLLDGQELVKTTTIWNGTILGFASQVPAGEHEIKVEWKADAVNVIECESATASIWQTTTDKMAIRRDVPTPPQ